MCTRRGLAARLFVAGLLVLSSAAAVTAQPFQVKNIDEVRFDEGSQPEFLADAGGVSFFAATDRAHGRELWITDGTGAGTFRLDLRPGPGGSEPQPIGVIGDLFYFLANSDRSILWHLWRSDGSAEGTFRLTPDALFLPPLTPDDGPLVGLLPGRGLLFFQAIDLEAGRELWATDGTVAGTRRVVDLFPGPEDSWPRSGVPVNDELLFVAQTPERGQELWTTDGTAEGTTLVADLVAGANGSGIRELTVFRDGALFTAADPDHGRELWTTDGTSGGTALVADLSPGSDDFNFYSGFTVDGGRAYFVAGSPTSTGQLWVTDGTAGGTVALTALAGFEFVSGPPTVAASGKVFFTARTSGLGIELWVTDGTVAGTRPVRDLCAGTCSSNPDQLRPFAGRLLFRAFGEDGDLGAWATDGTMAGTQRLAGSCPAPCSGAVELIGPSDGGFVFVAGPSLDPKLWVTGGTPAGTLLLDAFDNPTGFSSPVSYGTLDGVLLFAVDDGRHGAEPWRTDGTPGGTFLLANLGTVGDQGSQPVEFTKFDDLVFFAASDGVDGPEVWRSDGSGIGTVAVTDLPAPTPDFSSGISFLTRSGSDLYFVRTLFGRGQAGSASLWRIRGSDLTATELVDLSIGPFLALLPFEDGLLVFAERIWRTDGTAAGTRELARIEGIRAAFVFRDEAYFLVDDAPSTTGLWKTDGTAAGTVQLTHFGLPLLFGPTEFAVLHDRLFFSIHDEEHGQELWSSDGTAEGTQLFKDLYPGGAGSYPSRFSTVGSRLAFLAQDELGGPHLWATDGTVEGTARLSEAAVDGLPTSQIAPFPDRLFFIEHEFGGEPVLWRSDGSRAGTVPLPNALPAGRTLAQVHALAGRLLMTAVAFDPITFDRLEIWRGDGSASGTARVASFPYRGFSETPMEDAAAIGSLVLFQGYSDAQGDEPWGLDLAAPPPPLLPAPAAPAALTAEALFSDQAVLRWEDRSDNEDRFVVEMRSPTLSFPQQVLWLPADTESFRVGNLPPGPVTFRIRAENADRVSEWSNEASVTPLAGSLGPCVPSDRDLCLHGERMRVRVAWRDQHNFGSGVGTAMPFPGSGESGLFWFFDPANVELVVKVLDASTVNGYLWTFYGALSDVEYWITVTDTALGRNRTYHNSPGEICGLGDVVSFPEPAARESAGSERAVGFAGGGRIAVAPAPAVGSTRPLAAAGTGPCIPDARGLCLQGGRYRVEVDWHDQHNGGDGVGTAIPGTGDSGYFWFFDPANVELVVKVLDATTVNGHVWVFYGALSDVEYTIRVKDTATGAEKTYVNPPGSICGRADTEAF